MLEDVLVQGSCTALTEAATWELAQKKLDNIGVGYIYLTMIAMGPGEIGEALKMPSTSRVSRWV